MSYQVRITETAKQDLRVIAFYLSLIHISMRRLQLSSGRDRL